MFEATPSVTTSKNRIRFENISQRLQKVNVDIIHKVSAAGTLDVNAVAPSTGENGCFFQDELEQLKTLDITQAFQRFYHAVGPLVQSLPELLHHQEQVVNLLEKQISQVGADDLPSYLQLLSVLGRDLQDDLSPHLHRFLKVVISRIDSVTSLSDPALAGKMFNCVSYLLKFQLGALSENPDTLRQYYGELLGHPISYIRNFSSKSFVIVVRKLKPKAFKIHFKRIVKAIAANAAKVFPNEGVDVASLPIRELIARDCSKMESAYLPKRFCNIVEGVSLLLFYAMKGVKGCLHSQGGQKLGDVLDLLLPFPGTVADGIEEFNSKATTATAKKSGKGTKNLKSTQSDTDITVIQSASCELPSEILSVLEHSQTSSFIYFVYSMGQVVSKCVTKIFKHVNPSNFVDILFRLVELTKSMVKIRQAISSLSDAKPALLEVADISTMHVIEILLFALSYQDSRAISHPSVHRQVSSGIINSTFALCNSCLTKKVQGYYSNDSFAISRQAQVVVRARNLLCILWKCFPTDEFLLNKLDTILLHVASSQEPSSGAITLANELLTDNILPFHIVQAHLISPLLNSIAKMVNTPDSSPLSWLTITHEILLKLHDPRETWVAAEIIRDDSHTQSSQYHRKNVKDVTRRSADNNMEGDDWNYDEDGDDSMNGSDDEGSYDDEDFMDEVPLKASRKMIGIGDYTSMCTEESGDVQTVISQLLSESSVELSIIASACFDHISLLIPKDSDGTSSLASLTSTTIEEKDESTSSTSLLLALQCVQWLCKSCPAILEMNYIGCRNDNSFDNQIQKTDVQSDDYNKDVNIANSRPKGGKHSKKADSKVDRKALPVPQTAMLSEVSSPVRLGYIVI